MASINGITKPLEFKVGIIGGTGLEDPDVMTRTGEFKVDTPFGKPSDSLVEGTINGIHCVLLSRHGRFHRISPTNINYRANIWALKKAGVALIIACNACGSLREELAPGHIVVIDSLIDRTTKRETTFYDGKEGHPEGICHMPMHPTFNELLRKVLIAQIQALSLSHQPKGTLVCVEGPRFSTRAESDLFRSWGAHVVGMTTHPEAVLAKELGIPFATLAIVTDYDCWKDTAEGVSIELVAQAMHRNANTMKKLLIQAVQTVAKHKADFVEECVQARKLAIGSVMDGGRALDFDHLK